MKSPSPILRGLFVGGVGSLLVSVLFSINGWPAAELFAILGSAITLPIYLHFNRIAGKVRRSNYMRHVVLASICAAIILRSFQIALGSWMMLLAFISFLVWLAWTVLEDLPPSED